jgi:hypothetical protein
VIAETRRQAAEAEADVVAGVLGDADVSERRRIDEVQDVDERSADHSPARGTPASATRVSW